MVQRLYLFPHMYTFPSTKYREHLQRGLHAVEYECLPWPHGSRDSCQGCERMCGRTRGQSGIEKSSTAKTMCFLPLPDMLSTLQNSLLSVECVNAVPHPSAMLGSLEGHAQLRERAMCAWNRMMALAKTRHMELS